MTGLRVVEGRGLDDRQSGAARVVVEGISLRQSGIKLTYEGWDLVLHVVTPERLALLGSLVTTRGTGAEVSDTCRV